MGGDSGGLPLPLRCPSTHGDSSSRHRVSLAQDNGCLLRGSRGFPSSRSSLRPRIAIHATLQVISPDFLCSNFLITGSYGGPTWRPRSSYSSTSSPYPGSTKSWRWKNSGLGTTPFPGPSFRPWYTEDSSGQGQGQLSTSSSSYRSYWLPVS